jgi:nitrate reductase alpha subunit
MDDMEPFIRQVALAIYKRDPSQLSDELRAWCEMWLAVQKAKEEQKESGSNNTRTQS